MVLPSRNQTWLENPPLSSMNFPATVDDTRGESCSHDQLSRAQPVSPILLDSIRMYIYIYNIHVFHTFHHIFHSIYYVHCISKSTTFSSWYPLEPKVLTQLLIESLRFTSKAARLVVLGSMEVVLGLNRESTMTGGSKEDFLMTLVEFRKRSNPKNGHFKREQIRFSPTGDGCLIWGFPKVGVPPNHQF